MRLALAPPENHWWNIRLSVNAVGLTTSLMLYAGGGVEIIFDFQAHRLIIQTTAGARREMILAPRSVADFYAGLTGHLRDLGIEVEINQIPVEMPDVIDFAADETHATYDAEAVHAFWLSMVNAQRVFARFRGGFRGKASPVHCFWGAFDLAAPVAPPSEAPRRMRSTR